MHFPLISTLRSRYIPEEARTAVLNLVRIPLNLIVVVILLKVRAGPSVLSCLRARTDVFRCRANA